MKKLKTKQKAAAGLNKVVVPQAGNDMNVLNSAVSLGTTGFSVGGPVGGAVGAAAGIGMGLLQKGEMDRANQAAIKQNAYIAASQRFDGDEVTAVQNTQQFANGTDGTAATKAIEVEKDELVLRKQGGKFKLKADFQGGKPHSKGGEDYVAKEGDVIFPGKQRKTVLSHLKKGNHSTLEGMRMKLPKDTVQGEAKNGVDLLSTVQPSVLTGGGAGSILPTQLPGVLLPGQTVAGLSLIDQNAGFSADGTSQQLNPLTSYNYGGNGSASASATFKEGSAMGLGGVNIDGSNAAQYASLANNLIRGIQSPERVAENYVTPEQMSYTDRSGSQRQASRQALQVQKNQARNAGAGNAQVIRATQAAAQAGNTNRLMDIDNTEQARADAIALQNTQLSNQTEQVNSQKRDQYAQLNGQARANTQAYQDYAMAQLSSKGAADEKAKYMKSLDDKKNQYNDDYLNYLNQTYHYKINGDKQVEWNPDGSNTPTKGTTAKEEQTSKYDKNGRLIGSIKRRKPGILQ